MNTRERTAGNTRGSGNVTQPEVYMDGDSRRAKETDFRQNNWIKIDRKS